MNFEGTDDPQRILSPFCTKSTALANSFLCSFCLFFIRFEHLSVYSAFPSTYRAMSLLDFLA